MASITLTLNDAHVDRVAAGLGWPGLPGETKSQFVKRRIMELIKHEISSYEVDKKRAAQTADALDLT